MQKIIAILLTALAATADRAENLPEGWLTVVDSNAAARVARDYASNVMTCAWAGDRPSASAALPANAAFQFAVSGREQCVSNAQSALAAATEAIPTNLTPVIRHFRLLAPTLQWIVRSVKCGPNVKNYLRAANHPAAFAETDFNASNLTAFARNITAARLPPAATVWFSGEETSDRRPLVPTVPGVDYPGTLHETTFSTPFGVSMVIRAPESPRVFKFRAAAFPVSNAKASFAWVVLTGGAKVQSWNGNRQPKDGYGRILIHVGDLFARRRIDVAVFARWGEGPWGAPSVISFYASPYESRSYDKDELRQIKYLPQVRNPPPYDISFLCPPADWTDVYQHDARNQITGFSRLLPDGIRGESFSPRNEKIIESHPNETAKIAGKVRYFVKDGQLRCEETGEEVSYRLEGFRPRRLAK